MMLRLKRFSSRRRPALYSRLNMAQTTQTPSVEQQLATWLEAFPTGEVDARIEELEVEIAEREQENERSRDEIDRLRGLQELRTRLAPSTGKNGTVPEDAALFALAADTPRKRPASKREAVRAVLQTKPFESWPLPDIRSALVKRGWLGDNPKDRHALDMTLSNMVKDGSIERPGKGRYRLLPDTRRGDKE